MHADYAKTKGNFNLKHVLDNSGKTCENVRRKTVIDIDVAER